MIRIILIVIAFVLPPLYGFGQDITTSNLSWEIVRMDNRATGTFDERGGTIKSYSTDRIEWYDYHGVLKQTFAIRELNGGWSNVANNGFILYEVDSEGNPCTVTFQRDDASLIVTIVILKDNELPTIYEFTIQNLTTL